MTDQRVWALARRAAELLPGPPGPHDSFGYLAWEELVLSTARRLESLGDGTPAAAQASDLDLEHGSARLGAAGLLTLAALLARGHDAACERTLSDAVAVSRGDLTAPARAATSAHIGHRFAHGRLSGVNQMRSPLRGSVALAPRV